MTKNGEFKWKSQTHIVRAFVNNKWSMTAIKHSGVLKCLDKVEYTSLGLWIIFDAFSHTLIQNKSAIGGRNLFAKMPGFFNIRQWRQFNCMETYQYPTSINLVMSKTTSETV